MDENHRAEDDPLVRSLLPSFGAFAHEIGKLADPEHGGTNECSAIRMSAGKRPWRFGHFLARVRPQAIFKRFLSRSWNNVEYDSYVQRLKLRISDRRYQISLSTGSSVILWICEDVTASVNFSKPFSCMEREHVRYSTANLNTTDRFGRCWYRVILVVFLSFFHEVRTNVDV